MKNWWRTDEELMTNWGRTDDKLMTNWWRTDEELMKSWCCLLLFVCLFVVFFFFRILLFVCCFFLLQNFVRIFSGRFKTSGSLIPLVVPEISSWTVFVTRTRTAEELGILVVGFKQIYTNLNKSRIADTDWFRADLCRLPIEDSAFKGTERTLLLYFYQQW